MRTGEIHFYAPGLKRYRRRIDEFKINCFRCAD